MSAPAAAAAAPFRGPLKVEYCAACSMPPEYCEFGPSWEKCRVLLEAKHPDLLAAALAKMSVSSGAGAAAASSSSAAAAASSAPAGDDAKEAEKPAAKKKQPKGDDDDDEEGSDDDEDDEDDAPAAAAADEDEFLAAAAPVKPLKKAAASAGPGIYLSLTSRSRKKFITTVRGWESFGLVLKDVAKLLAKKFACAASVVKAADGSEIAIQGDLLMDLPQWIVEEFKQVDKKLIWTVDKAGKKVRAF